MAHMLLKSALFGIVCMAHRTATHSLHQIVADEERYHHHSVHSSHRLRAVPAANSSYSNGSSMKTPIGHPDYNHHHGHRCGTLHPEADHLYGMAEAHADHVRKAFALTGSKSHHDHHRRHLNTIQYTIRIYLHVMRSNDGLVGDIPEYAINTMMQQLNQKFNTTPFVFTLSGVNRINNSSWLACTHGDDPKDEYLKERTYKTQLRVNGSDILNVYTCDLLGSQSLWGYTYYPPALVDYPVYDGIVIHNTFVDQDGWDMDMHMTLVHELGHWLGLLHTNTGRCSPFNSSKAGYDNIELYPDYYLNGDGVRDTPAHIELSSNLPGRRTCWVDYEPPHNQCTDDRPDEIDPGPDPIRNHMNYIPTRCQLAFGEFTPGQSERMIAQFEKYRVTAASKCMLTNGTCALSSECCGGNLCIADINGTSTCQPCRAQLQQCSANWQCCNPNICFNQLCRPCRLATQSCKRNADCCGRNVCTLGRCKPPCRKVGMACRRNTQCCGRSICINRKCQRRQ